MYNLREKLDNFLVDNDLKYYKSSEDDQVYRILLPYNYKDLKRITIFIDVFLELNLLKIGFHEEINKNDIENVKTKLLDKNGKLIFGTLSLERESNIVTFSIDWFIDESEEIQLVQYQKNILYALKVYEDLLSDEVIIYNEGI